MIEEKILVPKPGEKFVHKQTKTVYIVKTIKGKEVLLVSEDGKASMLIQGESLVLAGFEPYHG